MRPPKISVIMSVFNGETFLREAIDGILSQTFDDFEFIIVDDGSNDRTGQILRSYTDPRIRILSQSNRGLTRSLNVAISLSRGTYLARQDADDISLPNRLQVQSSFLDEHQEVGLVGTYYQRIDQKGSVLQHMKPAVRSEDLKKRMERGNQFAHGSVMLRRACVEQVGSYREEFQSAQDFDFWLRISECSDVANIPEYLYRWRLTPDSESVARRARQNCFALLAVELANERKLRGTDSLQRLPTPDRTRWVQEFVESRMEKGGETGKELGYNYWARILLDNGNDREALRFLLRSISAHPFRIDTWKLICRAGIRITWS